MSFDALAQAIVSAEALFLCLSIYVVTYVIRSLVDGIAGNALKQVTILGRLWSEVFLPILPIVIGGLMGLMAKTFIWPDVTNGTTWGRIFYGAVCGLLSTFVYNRIRAWINSSSSTT